jgi:hypothetical protein
LPLLRLLCQRGRGESSSSSSSSSNNKAGGNSCGGGGKDSFDESARTNRWDSLVHLPRGGGLSEGRRLMRWLLVVFGDVFSVFRLTSLEKSVCTWRSPLAAASPCAGLRACVTAASGGSLLFDQYAPFAILQPKNRKTGLKCLSWTHEVIAAGHR